MIKGKKTNNPKYRKAFRIIFKKILTVNDSSQVLIIYDESFTPYFPALLDVAKALSLSVSFVFIPMSYQKFLINSPKFNLENGEISLPNGVVSAIANSNVVLSCLDGDILTSKFRGAILHQKKPKNHKLAHCPGISEEIFDLVIRSSYSKILQSSALMAWALGTAEQGTLITKDKTGKEYTLELKLDSWKNEPLMSPGVIFENSWGNITPGETFCCPKMSGVNGEICIDGSINRLLLADDDDVVLTFAKGKLTEHNAPASAAAYVYFDNLKKISDGSKDENWNSFAELGIGLNPAIKKLTGNPLFDEKMAGTIHVAIGDNAEFGHHIKSSVHIDMVSLKPTLLLDGNRIIHEGNLDLSAITTWKRNYPYPKLSLLNNSMISIFAGKISINRSSITRKWMKGNRAGYVKILNGKLTQLFLKIQSDFENENEVKFEYLVKKAGASQKKDLIKLLEVLNQYQIIDVK